MYKLFADKLVIAGQQHAGAHDAVLVCELPVVKNHKPIVVPASLLEGSSAADMNAEDALAGAHVDGKLA